VTFEGHFGHRIALTLTNSDVTKTEINESSYLDQPSNPLCMT